MVSLFSTAANHKDIIFRLSASTNVLMEKGETIIFFGEVQECSEIITAIKFLVDEGSYSYILSGSFIKEDLKYIRFVPVGYLTTKKNLSS